MPPLGTFVEDTIGIQLISNWIQDYLEHFPLDLSSHAPKAKPFLNGLSLVLPERTLGPIRLQNIRGQQIRLHPLNETTFVLPEHLKHGLYILRIGSQSYTLRRY